MSRIGYDYWADNFEVFPDGIVEERGPATLGDLMLKLKTEDSGYLKEKARDGETELKYFFGKIVIRGRVPEGVAYKLTIQPKGLLKKTFERNHDLLREIFESSGIKLTRCKEQ